MNAANGKEPDIEGCLVQLDGILLEDLLAADPTDTVLANSLRRIAHDAGRWPQDTVAAFNNYI